MVRRPIAEEGSAKSVAKKQRSKGTEKTKKSECAERRDERRAAECAENRYGERVREGGETVGAFAHLLTWSIRRCECKATMGVRRIDS